MSLTALNEIEMKAISLSYKYEPIYFDLCNSINK
ncbi:hypothetical protein Cha6605_1954 [Chamaesiphon minutus PCC 6605]|uniref:Uncharacterized protein n=1 Tax=Chamaesiphon minutus (strain ATCC 27169 / PCC 6605) TaxID=1173020 RepID=K9UF50_CHAP6|nr:hypothetical protein Cha6605_1954 [Chamaesiphon minutus PCC 6605]